MHPESSGEESRSDEPPSDERGTRSTRRSLFARLLVTLVVGAVVWRVLPGVPRDQTVIFALGDGATHIAQLDVEWEKVGTDHVGQLRLNFPPRAPRAPATGDATTSAPASGDAPDGQRDTPARIARTFRLADGEYSFRVGAVRSGTSSERTEVTRRVTLEGNAVTLRLEELTR